MAYVIESDSKIHRGCKLLLHLCILSTIMMFIKAFFPFSVNIPLKHRHGDSTQIKQCTEEKISIGVVYGQTHGSYTIPVLKWFNMWQIKRNIHF